MTSYFYTLSCYACIVSHVIEDFANSLCGHVLQRTSASIRFSDIVLPNGSRYDVGTQISPLLWLFVAYQTICLRVVHICIVTRANPSKQA